MMLTIHVSGSPHFFYIMRCIPVSASQTKMEYEVYRHKDATDEEFTYITETFRTILKEDKDLCNAAQKNLNGNVFINGELHPMAEKVSLMARASTVKHTHAHTDQRYHERVRCISKK